MPSRVISWIEYATWRVYVIENCVLRSLGINMCQQLYSVVYLAQCFKRGL
jgi:hypothetical protein